MRLDGARSLRRAAPALRRDRDRPAHLAVDHRAVAVVVRLAAPEVERHQIRHDVLAGRSRAAARGRSPLASAASSSVRRVSRSSAGQRAPLARRRRPVPPAERCRPAPATRRIAAVADARSRARARRLRGSRASTRQICRQSPRTRAAPSDAGSTVAAMSYSVATASGVSSRGCANSANRSKRQQPWPTRSMQHDAALMATASRRASFHGVHYSEEMDWIFGAWGRILTGIHRRCRSKSPANVRCAVRDATRTATTISAATSRCARCATSKARN